MSWVLDHLPWLPKGAAFDHRLPGIGPLDVSDWLLRDAAFAAQMAERDRLIETCPGKVMAGLPEAEEAVGEVLEMILNALDAAYDIRPDRIRRPDGVVLSRRNTSPLALIGRLVQEDVCLLGPDGAGDWRLAAATLCFPAYWSLEEKIGRDLAGLHRTIDVYDANIAKRVRRLFDAVPPDRVLMRYNAHPHFSSALFTPKREDAPMPSAPGARPLYLRSERQTLRRLPRTGWVAFGIHTGLMPFDNLSPLQASQF